MPESRFWNLLAKQLSGEATEAEQAELEELIRNHPDWGYAAQHLHDLWQQPITADPAGAEAAWQQHLGQMRRQGLPVPGREGDQKQKIRLRPLLVGLPLLLLVAGTWWWWPAHPDQMAAAQVHEISTRPGARTYLQLPDSSKVYLNAGSRLTYEAGFGSSHRRLRLTGEAYFDVRKSSIPFLIETEALAVRVTGTAFNIKSYPGEATAEASLLRGSITVTVNRAPEKSYVLQPNEKLVVSHPREPAAEPGQPVTAAAPLVVRETLTQTTDSTIVETSWVADKLVFQDESFATVARKMERWYDVTIELRGSTLPELRLTGSFEHENVQQALEALQITAGFTFTIEGDRIQISPE